jgi:uncharacterized membrane protein YesL
MLPADEEPRLDRHSYVRLTVARLWENLPLVLLAGLLFSLLCVPATLLAYANLLFPSIIVGAFTAAPAWAALLAQEAEITLGVKTGIGTMLRAFPRFWTRSARLGVLLAFPVSMFLLTVPLLARPEVPAIVWLGLAADLFGLFLLVILYLYAFPLLVLHDIGVGLALRDALALAGRYIGNTLGLLSIGVLFGFAVAYLSPGLLLVLPAIWGVFIVNHCRMVVDEAARKAAHE